MAFSADAIGFYLQAENQLSPTLKTAAKDYGAFVAKLEGYNKQAYKTATKGLDQLADLVASFDELPSRATASYDQAIKKVAKRIRPLTQPISLVFNATSRTQLGRALGEAVSRALTGAKLRLSASMPQQRVALFDQSVSLRSQYKKFAQPPDMVGNVQPKRFKKGGLVEGGKPGKDSVLSLLEPGEFVLAKTVVDDLKKMGPIKGASGKFVSPDEIGASIARMDNLGKALTQLKDVLDSGLGDPRLAKLYESGLKEIDAEMLKFEGITKKLAYRHRKDLTPALNETRAKIKALRPEVNETAGVFERFFTKVLGPVRFLAINKALGDTVEGLSKLKDSGLQTFDALGGDQVESFTTNMNQLNTRLGLTRGELREFKRAALDVANLHDLNVNEASEAIEGLTEAGVRSKEMLLELTPSVTSFSRATKVGFDQSAQIAYKLADAYGFTSDQIAGFFADTQRLGKETNVKTEELVAHMQETLTSLGPALAGQSVEARRAVLGSLAALDATLQSQWADGSGALQKLIADALSGQVDAMQNAQLVFGKSTEALKADLTSGNISGLLDTLAGQVQSLASSGNIAGLEALRQAMNFPGTVEEFQKIGTNAVAIREQLGRLSASRTDLDGLKKVQDELNESADRTRTTYDSLSTEFGQLAAKEIPFLNFSMGDAVDFLKDFNVQTLFSIAYLSKLGVEAVAASAKGLMSLGSILGGLIKRMGLFGATTAAATTATTAASGVGGAVGAGGFFAGIAAGMTALAGGIAALGAVLMSPPGIAFTVTLVVAVLALAAALRIATPALEVWGKVATAVIQGAVEAFSAFVPVMLKMVEVAGTVLVAGLQSLVQVFQTLFQADFRSLLTAGPALGAMAVGLLALAGAVTAFGAALAAVQVSQGLLSLIGVAGAGTGQGIFGLVNQLVGSLGASQVTSARLRELTDTVDGMGGFMRAYGRLAQVVQSLPEQGIFSRLFGDDAAQNFREQAGPLLQAVSEVMDRAGQLGSLRQPRQANAVSVEQIRAAIDARVASPVDDKIAAASEKTNELLGKILDALSSRERSSARERPASAPRTPPMRGLDPVTSSLAAFDL